MEQNKILPPMPGIERYFHVQRFSFACVCVNVLSLNRTITNHLKLGFLMVSQILFSFVIFLYAVQKKDDLVEATDALSPFWQLIISIFKLLHFLWNSKKIITIIRKLWLWNLEAKGEEHAILAAENRKDVIFSTFYHYVVLSTGIAAVVAPFVVAAFYAQSGESFWKYLEPPSKALYYIDKKSNLGFVVAYMWNICCDYFIIYSSISIDSLFFWFICNIAAHFRILKYRMRQAGNQNNGNCSTKTICDCIAYHRRVLDLAHNFNDIFRVVIFIKFAISCLQICCLAFQLSRDVEFFGKVYYGLFFITVFMQLLLYCYGGQRIQDESESVGNAIYESFNWESLTVANKRLLLFSLRRSQIPCTVSGILFTANMSLFLWVYRTAASFVTLLRTVEEKDK